MQKNILWSPRYQNDKIEIFSFFSSKLKQKRYNNKYQSTQKSKAEEFDLACSQLSENLRKIRIFFGFWLSDFGFQLSAGFRCLPQRCMYYFASYLTSQFIAIIFDDIAITNIYGVYMCIASSSLQSMVWYIHV